MTVRTALLLLHSSTTKFNGRMHAALRLASSNVSERLYVHIYSTLKDNRNIQTNPPVSRILSCSSQFYAAASALVPSLDVTLLHRYHKDSNHLKHAVELLLVETEHTPQLNNNIGTYYQLPSNLQVLEYTAEELTENDATVESAERTFDYCALGGTFDNIHNGHKILLGAGISMTEKALTIGVTDQSMNKKKTLRELIAPVEERKAAVRAYVEEVSPDIDYDIVSIHDPYGPTITEQRLQCLIVSEETRKGTDLINEKRLKKVFPPMASYCIPLVTDQNRSEHQEHKISSSSLREQRLGTLLHPTEDKPSLAHRPYLIGLTGGIASGKSSVGKRLEVLGAGLINSDVLAHQVYKRGCDAYHQVVDTFGKEILHPKTGEIERSKLGAIVFSDKTALDKLNSIVWPATSKLVEEKVLELHQQGKEVCFIEAALLLEANWQSRLHEVWSCFVPEEEAVARLKERNSLGEEEALKRIRSQADNQFRVDRSNVVLCTIWDYPVTQRQVEKAWHLLQERLSKSKTS